MPNSADTARDVDGGYRTGRLARRALIRGMMRETRTLRGLSIFKGLCK